MSDISIIIPCFNEENNINHITKQIYEIKKKNSDLFLDFIIVNNGSTDGTLNYLLNLNKNNLFTIVNLENNLGYGGGIIAGIKKARGKILSWTHGDLQCDINDVINAYRDNREKLLSYNCVVKGRRIKRRFFDSFFSFFMGLIASMVFFKRFSEINAQPKIFSSEIAKYLKNAPSDFSLDLFLLYISKKNNFEIVEYPVVYKKRIYGISKGGDSIKGKIKLTLRSLKYIFKLRFRINDINSS